MLKILWNGVLDLVYPPNCLICKQFCITRPSRGILCLTCQQKIEFNIPPFCRLCSRTIGARNKQNLCLLCRTHKPHFDGGWGCCLYNDTLARLIHMYKYGNKMLLRHLFAEYMISFIERYQIDLRSFDLIIPVPLFSTRQRERGYNQSELLAGPLSIYFQIPILMNNLVRVKYTSFQARLSEKERWTNIQGAFRIKHPSEVKNKSILLIDDLLTTGATASESAKTLKKAGAKEVYILTLAIA